jgi:hypothetical protein
METNGNAFNSLRVARFIAQGGRNRYFQAFYGVKTAIPYFTDESHPFSIDKKFFLFNHSLIDQIQFLRGKIMMATDESMVMNPNAVFNDPSFLRNFDLAARNRFLREAYGPITFECDCIKIYKEPYGSLVFERKKSLLGWLIRSRMTFTSDGVRTMVENEQFGKKIVLYQTHEPISFQSE